MKNGTCPMCNATTVYVNPDVELRASTTGIQLRDFQNALIIYVTPYVCIQCGHIAMFAKEMERIKDLPAKKGWKQVQELLSNG